MSDIQKFDPSTLMQGVKDRIKATFVSLIPDDQWDAMVQKEIDAFFDPSTHYSKRVEVININGWDGRQEKAVTVAGNTSVFRALVFELCFEKAIEALKKKLTDEYFVDGYDQAELKEGMTNIVASAIPMATERFFQSMALNYMQNLKSDIQNHRI